jgi:sulfite exporter TauE/SafE
VSIGVLLSAWLVGALGGVHCVAMCGGLLGALGARDGASVRPLQPARTLARTQLAYHSGRIAMYTLLGAVFGGAGAATIGIVDLLPVQRALYVAANGLLLVLGAQMVVRLPASMAMQRTGLRVFAPALRALQPMLARQDAVGRAAMGLVWGLMPCALIYGVLPVALLAGGPVQGGAVMLAFGLGTLPNLAATGVLLASIRRWLSRTTLRALAAAWMIAFGSLGIWRLLFVPGTLAQGPFCLVPGLP